MRDGVGYRNGDVCFVCFMTILMEKKVCYLITVDKFEIRRFERHTAVVTYVHQEGLAYQKKEVTGHLGAKRQVCLQGCFA